MSPAVRTLVETGLVAAFVALVCAGGWAIEKYESSHAAFSRRRDQRGAAHASRAPHTRTEIRQAICDLRGIRTTRSARPTAPRFLSRQERNDGQATAALGRRRPRRPSR